MIKWTIFPWCSIEQPPVWFPLVFITRHVKQTIRWIRGQVMMWHLNKSFTMWTVDVHKWRSYKVTPSIQLCIEYYSKPSNSTIMNTSVFVFLTSFHICIHNISSAIVFFAILMQPNFMIVISQNIQQTSMTIPLWLTLLCVTIMWPTRMGLDGCRHATCHCHE